MTTHHDTDRHLADAIRAARDGDTDALGVVYARYERPVRAHVQRILGDAHEAEDVTQQVFLRLGTALTRYEERSAPFPAWLMRVARNAALDRLRMRSVLPLGDDDAAGVGSAAAEAHDALHERRACLREALAGLPDDQRQVLLMRHVVGLTTPEIAASLGRTEGSVHALHHRGRAGLRRRLDALGMAPATIT